MANRLASVLTPVHETKLPLLERAYKSVLKQGLSEKDLEWVLLLHNCSVYYKKEVYERFGQSGNILIREADMSGTGLAFAREKALKAASGEYLFFLDSDDELSPKCVEKVVIAMDETCADTAVYSAWVQTGQLGFACFCDADPKRGKLLLNKGDNRVGSTLCYSGAGLWTRACRRSFLEENGIGFDESRPNHITDPIFNFEVALSAERTVVLSSLVGYIYHYGIGMLLSDRNQAADDILSLCETYISDYKKRGLAADNLIWFFLRLYLFLAEGQKEDTSKMEGFCRAKGIAGVLAPPKMDWVYLQNGADRIYAEVIKRIG